MKNKTFNDLVDSIKELHDKKNHDYASADNPYSNFEFAAKFVELFTDPVDQVFAGRIGDKFARLGQLLSTKEEILDHIVKEKSGEKMAEITLRKEPNFESIEDTMRDITTLCAIWTARRIDKNTNPLNVVGSKERDEAIRRVKDAGFISRAYGGREI